MLLDEPASALDLSHQASLLGLIRELCRGQNKAVVMIVHDLNMAWDVASHVLLLHGNGFWEAGKREAMMCRSACNFRYKRYCTETGRSSFLIEAFSGQWIGFHEKILVVLPVLDGKCVRSRYRHG